MYYCQLDNNLFYKYQSGFSPHHTTVFQLFELFHNICQAFGNNMFSCIVFCDGSVVYKLARQWLVTFHPLKTEAVLFTLKKLDFLPQLVLIIF